LEATDRSLDPPEISASSINLASVRQLLKKYEQFSFQSAEEMENGRNQQNALDTYESLPSPPNWRAASNRTEEYLGGVDRATTTAALSTPGLHLLSPIEGEQCRSGGGER
jgi:hypothetical protein